MDAVKGLVESPSVPPEVWSSILSHLEEPKDLLNAIRICKKWDYALKPKKSAIYLSNIFPFVFQYLESPEVVILRRVCKPLKIAVDNYLDTKFNLTDPNSFNFNQFNFNSGKKNMHMPNFLLNCYWFTTARHRKSASAFMDKMSSHRGNPFIGRSIKIELCGPPPSYQPFLESVKEMLTRFGNELKQMIIHVTPSSVSQEAISNLRSLLSLVPNLQSLRIYWGGESMIMENNVLQNDQPPPTPEDICGILRDNSSPFPQLKNLTCLNFSCGGIVRSYSVPLGHFLVETFGSQLNRLICQGELLRGDLLNMVLPNMKSLRVVDVTPRAVEELGKVKWGLEQLQIHDGVFENASPATALTNLVDVINNFASNLIHLEANVHLVDDWRDAWEVGQNWQAPLLPKLKFLSTGFANTNSNWFCELIRLKCGNLKVLEFQTDLLFDAGWRIYMNDAQSREFVKNHIQVKNWFQLLPKLDKVRFRLGFGESPFDSYLVYRQDSI